MSLSVLSTWTMADLAIRYLRDPATGAVAFQLVPSSRLTELAPPAFVADPLVRVKRAGYPAPAGAAFRFDGQSREVHGTRTSVVTTFVDGAADHVIEHCLSWNEGDEAVEIEVCFLNDGQEPVTLEALTSFSLGGLTPFACAGIPGRLRAHRFRSAWSAEGRGGIETLEQGSLEHLWSDAGLYGERFGQPGEPPVRRWQPFVALEDIGAGVVWAAQLAGAASWQMEISRRNDDVCLSGGLADREFGHWLTTLVPGECFEAPPAFLSCVAGDLEAACDRLAVLQRRAAGIHPALIVSSPGQFLVPGSRYG